MKYYKITMYIKEEDCIDRFKVRKNKDVWETYNDEEGWWALTKEHDSMFIEDLDKGGYIKDSFGWKFAPMPFTMEECKSC